jgi:hypothetical protein
MGSRPAARRRGGYGGEKNSYRASPSCRKERRERERGRGVANRVQQCNAPAPPLSLCRPGAAKVGPTFPPSLPGASVGGNMSPKEGIPPP